jgi:hypothetical protein
MMKNHLPHGSDTYTPAEGDIIYYKFLDLLSIHNERVALLVEVESARYQDWRIILDGALATVSMGFTIDAGHIEYVKIIRHGQLIIDWRCYHQGA